MKNVWDNLDTFPPIACRLLARVKQPEGGIRPMTSVEIGLKCGLSPLEVNSLSWLPTWDNVPVAVAKKFTAACGVDLSSRANIKSHSAYIRRGGSWKYLKQSPEWDNYYKPMIVAYVGLYR